MKFLELCSSFSFLRLISLIGTAIFFLLLSPEKVNFYGSLPNNNFILIIWVTGMAHFSLGIIYAIKAIDLNKFTTKSIFSLAGTCSFGGILFSIGFPANILQSYHHAASEGYTNRIIGKQNRPSLNLHHLQNYTFWVHLILFFFLARNSFYLTDMTAVYLKSWLLDLKFLSVGLIISYFLYFKYLFKIRRLVSRRELIELSIGEVILIGAVAYSFVRAFSTLELALYHRFFWTLYPAAILLKRSGEDFQRYVVLTVLTAIFFYAVAHLDWVQLNYVKLYLIIGYTHIILSLPFSHANPAWIKRLYSPST